MFALKKVKKNNSNIVFMLILVNKNNFQSIKYFLAYFKAKTL